MTGKNPQKVVFSRTDSIGDVILTLPMIGLFKESFPGCKVVLLGKNYTRAISDACKNIDQFADWDEINSRQESEQLEFFKSFRADAFIHVFPNKKIARLAKRANIPLRIGTSHRVYHWLNCNRLLNFTRKNSDLHEAQLNLKLLEPFGITDMHSLKKLENYFGFKTINSPDDSINSLIDKNRINLILHPKSKGSAREWGLDNFSELIKLLPEEKFKIFITGTKEEGEMVGELLSKNPKVIDLTGKFSLEQLISFINFSDGIVAASTGPLHIAAALGKTAFGIYAPMRPIHPGRWKPLGKNAHVFVSEKKCTLCRKTKDCICIRNISPGIVAEKLMGISK